MQDSDHQESFIRINGEVKDKRDRLSQNLHQQHPFNCIGLLVFLRKGQTATCTAFAISKKFIITAAHNFKNSLKKIDKNQQILFYPRIRGKQVNPFKVIDYRICPDYVKLTQKYSLDIKQPQKQKLQLQGQEFDYALLKLQKPIENQKGFIEIISEFNNLSTKCLIYGYPGDKVTKEKSRIGGKSQFAYEMYGHQNGIRKIIEHRIQHTVDTSKGQSGSAILVKKSNNRYYAIGIHIQEGDKTKQFNVGLRFTNKIIGQLRKWEEQMTINKFKFQQYNKNEFELEFNWKLEWPKSNQYFTIEDKTITNINSNNGMQQIIGLSPSPDHGTYQFSAKVIAYGNKLSWWSIGILTESLKNKASRSINFLQEESFGLWISNIWQKGYHYIGSTKKVNGPELYLNVGEKITMQININDMQITWRRPREIGNTYKISNLKGQKFYIYVCSSSPGDKIEIQ